MEQTPVTSNSPILVTLSLFRVLLVDPVYLCLCLACTPHIAPIFQQKPHPLWMPELSLSCSKLTATSCEIGYKWSAFIQSCIEDKSLNQAEQVSVLQTDVRQGEVRLGKEDKNKPSVKLISVLSHREVWFKLVCFLWWFPSCCSIDISPELSWEQIDECQSPQNKGLRSLFDKVTTE